MTAWKKLTPTEQALAYLIGGGVALAMIALLLIGFGTVENSDITTSLLLVGVALVVVGIGAWLILVRPWESFDDLKTPQMEGQAAHAPAPQAEAEAPAAVVEAAPVAEAAPAPETPTEAPAPTAPLHPGADDLTLIEGIGPKTAAALIEAGITTFAQVAAMSPDDLLAAARAHGARVNKADTWPEQARKAASGDLTALEDAQQRIKAGEHYDDLTQIEGLGPKSQEALYAAGIRTFRDVADTTPEHLREVLQAAGLKLVMPDTWPQQAGLIVAGDLTALAALQGQLKGGRRAK